MNGVQKDAGKITLAGWAFFSECLRQHLRLHLSQGSTKLQGSTAPEQAGA